jgi:predicted nucleic acid-binding protein
MLIAVDTNVLLDLAGKIDDVADAVLVIRRRVHKCQLVITPTVREELAHEAIHGEDIDKMENARRAFQVARSRNIRVVDLPGLQHDTARRIGRRLRASGLIPLEEVNDGMILAEAALLGCAILLTSDAHLRGVDFTRLAFELQACDASAPIVATPREIARKFFQ